MNLSFLAASGLTFLTEQQKTAYLLRVENMSYKRIGQEMGITANAARDHVKRAEWKVLDYIRLEQNQQHPTLIYKERSGGEPVIARM